MPAFSNTSNRVDSEPLYLFFGLRHRKELAVGGGLFLLLAYCTATIFVKGAWALQSFQIGIFILVALCALTAFRGKDELFICGWTGWLVYLIPIWGIIQILAHTTASSFETREAVLRWAALAGVFFLSQTVARTNRAEHIALSVFLWFATAMALLCLAQLYTSMGRVLWIFPTGDSEVFATFPSHNNYAQFVELALPIALWYALRRDRRTWLYALAGGILYASAVVSASRAGAALCTAEVLAILVIGWRRLRDAETGIRTRTVTSMLVMIPILAALCTLVVGWQKVWHRFEQDDKFVVRREYLDSAVDMARNRPLTGFGLGTFPEVYQRFAVRDFPFYANHAHNDWAEFAADGGVPFLLLVLIPFAASVPIAFRHPWGLGLVAVMLHACVDFPFPRPAVSGWMFLLLGLLYMTRARKKHRKEFAEAWTVDQASAGASVG